MSIQFEGGLELILGAGGPDLEPDRFGGPCAYSVCGYTRWGAHASGGSSGERALQRPGSTPCVCRIAPWHRE